MNVFDDFDTKTQNRRRLYYRLGIGLCVHGAALLVFQMSWIASTRLIPVDACWDSWHHASECTWIIASMGLLLIALANTIPLMESSVVSRRIQLHAGSIWILSIFSFVLLDTMHSTPFAIAIYTVSLYCILPQLFLWRRLGVFEQRRSTIDD